MRKHQSKKVEVHYLDDAALSSVGNQLRNSNEVYPDRQVRVKIEAYEFDPSEVLGTPRNRDGQNGVKKESDGSDGDQESSECEGEKHEKDLGLKNNHLMLDLLPNAKDVEIVPTNFKIAPETPTKRRKVSSDSLVFGQFDQLNMLNIWKGKYPRRGLFHALIAILNESFNDYDFTRVQSEQFRRRDVSDVMKRIQASFYELSTVNKGDDAPVMKNTLADLWTAIDKLVGQDRFLHVATTARNGCDNIFSTEHSEDEFDIFVDSTEKLLGVEVYSYIPERQTEIDADPLSSLGNLWAMNYFFCNPKLGKVVMVACSCRQRKFSQEGDAKALQWLTTLQDDNDREISWIDSWEGEVDSATTADEPLLVEDTNRIAKF